MGVDDITLEGMFRRSATYEGIESDFAAAHPRPDLWTGIAAAMVACVLSGGAGVSLEKLFRARGEYMDSFWIRNVQLSFYTIWPTLFIGVFFLDGEHIEKTGFFAGYNWTVWGVVALQALGGVLVACSINETDATTKNFMTSLSAPLVIVASAFSPKSDWSLLVSINNNTSGFKLTSAQSMIGVVITVYASSIYASGPEILKSGPPPISVTQHDKLSESGYHDTGRTAALETTPVRDPPGDALSTSRPGTPVNGRRSLRSRSRDNR
jgi:hypothetical protein